MTRLVALETLAAKVEAGEATAEDFFEVWTHKPYQNWLKGHNAMEAYKGSLDTAIRAQKEK